MKTLFAMAVGSERELGLDEAYARLGLVMEGTHHRGADDACRRALPVVEGEQGPSLLTGRCTGPFAAQDGADTRADAASGR